MSETSPLIVRIAEFVDGIRFDRLSDQALAAARRLLLDTLGCAFGALDAEPVRLLYAALPGLDAGPAPGRAQCLGTGRWATPEAATTINGALIRYLDFMDVYWSRDICHPAENIAPALAATQAAGGDGRRLIEAIAAGYEVQIRLCDAFSFQDRGFHHVSAAGFAAAFAAGKGMGLPAQAMAHAAAVSGLRHLTLGVLSKGDLSMAKATGFAFPAAESLTACRLAEAGFTGPLQVLEWLFERSAGAKEDLAAFAFDNESRMPEVSLKAYPVQYALQAPAEAAERLHDRVAGRLDAIDKIRVGVRAETLARTADPKKFAPKNRETADHSLPSCVAMALADGKLDEMQFHAERFLDPDVMRLTGLVDAFADADFEARLEGGRPGSVEVVLNDGSRFKESVEVPAGDRTRPMDEAAVAAKFLSLAEPVFGRAEAEKVIDRVGAIESQADLSWLFDLCTTKGAT